MLKTKHLVVLAAVLVVLAGISYLQWSGHRSETNRPAHTVLVAADLALENLDRLVCGYGDQPEAVVMVNGPDGWTLDTAWHARVSEARLDALVRVLAGLNGEFRSDEAGVLADYGLGPGQAVTIRGLDDAGQEVFALDVGNSVEGRPGHFVRRSGGNAVYLTRAALLSQFGLYDGPALPASRHFLELQVVQDDRNGVDAVTLWDEHGERTLVKEFATTEPAPDDTTGAGPTVDRLTWEWRLDGLDGESLAKTRADAVLGAVTSLRAVDVDDPRADPADFGLAEPARVVRVSFADGRELELEFGAERPAAGGGPAGVWMRTDGGPTIWVVGAHTVKSIFQTVDDLRPES